MSVLEIVKYPDPFLKTRTSPVENIDETVRTWVENMAETMYKAPGVGLAAIQVGIDKRIIVYDEELLKGESPALRVIINPVIIHTEGSILSESEACLSVPDYCADVKRAKAVIVEGVDLKGRPVRVEKEGIQAIVLQHEIDHLEGTLYIDRISSLKREMYKRRMKKISKST